MYIKQKALYLISSQKLVREIKGLSFSKFTNFLKIILNFRPQIFRGLNKILVLQLV